MAYKDKTNEEAVKIKAFLQEVVALSRKHNLSIAHEDQHGAFLIEEYKDVNITWLMAADYGRYLDE